MSIWNKGKEQQIEHLKKISKLGIAKLKSNPEFHRQIAIMGGKKAGTMTSREQLVRMGRNSRIRENKVIDKLKDNFDFVFQPFEVCDRIAVKNGELYFIEVKSPIKPKLKPKQEQFRNVVKDKYIVVISEE